MTEAPPLIALRVDGNAQIGSGHVMRCLTLARELARRGARIEFICRDLPQHLVRRIEREGHGLLHLAAAVPAAASSHGLPVSPSQDARETRSALDQLRPDWLVVDHYQFDVEWERLQRPAVRSIMVIDDLADRVHDCDVLLDQNYNGAATADRYQGLVPQACRLLLGPRYALLQPEYAALRRALVPRGHARRVLVFCGGGDCSDETSKILRALSTPEFEHLALDVVIGADHPAPSVVASLAAARRGATVHRDLPSLAGLMFRADVAIGAGGVSSWERLCLQLPSVVITIAANQEPATAALAAQRLVIWAGRAPGVSIDEIAAAVRSALASTWDSRSLVDGHGVLRTVAALLPSASTKLHLQRATRADCELLFEWRNDSQSRAMSFDTQVIDWTTHVRWFEAQLEDPKVEILIAWDGELPVGQVRLDSRQAEAVLSYGVDPLVRGRGLGTQLVAQAVRRAGRCGIGRLSAHVKRDNLASRRIFEQLGWQCAESPTDFVYRCNPGQPR